LELDPRSFLIARLGEEDLVHIESFDCDEPTMNTFFRNECLDEQKLGLNSTYALYYKGELAALCSICADKISLATSEKDNMNLPRNSVPAVKIARLARDKKFRDLRLGIYLFDYVRLQILESSENIGIRLITLDAYPERVEYYKSIGFIVNANQGKNSNNTVSMRFDIFTLNE
jgi:hypothetical protein